MKKDVSVIILAAGKSSRMGRPKMFLKLKNGLSFMENLLIEYTGFGCKKVIVVLNTENYQLLEESGLAKHYSFQMVLNHHPEKERFYSIQCGLKDLKNSDSVYIHNVDNPFADQELLQQLYDRRKQADYVKPVFENRGGHPILISRKIVDEIIMLNDKELPIKPIVNENENHQFQNQFSSFLPHPQGENADNWCFFAPLGVRGNRKKHPIHNGNFKTFLNKFVCEKVESDNDHIFTNINSESDYPRLLQKGKT